MGEFQHSGLTAGTHTIYLKVQDDQGEWSDEVSDTLDVLIYVPANEIPSVSIITPTNNAEISGEVYCSGLASDGDGEIEKVEISIDGGPWMKISGRTSWTYDWETKNEENGPHTFSVRSYDGEDYSDVASVTVTVNNEEKEDDVWYEEPVYLGGITSLIIVVVIIVSLIVIRKRNEDYYDEWEDDEEYEN